MNDAVIGRHGDVSSSMPRPPWRPGPRLRVAFDIVPVLLLLLFVLVVAGAGGSHLWFFLGLAQTLPLMWRRTQPTWVYSAVVAGSAVQALLVGDPLPSQLAYPIALYNLARRRGPVTAGIGLAVAMIGAVVASLVWTNEYAIDDQGLSDYLPTAIMIGAIVTVAWALGTLGRVRDAYVEALVEQGEQRIREAEQRVLLAASAERARIAREMHDVVAHGLSVIIVQADGARYAAERRPEVAVRTLETIAETGRGSLTDMRRLLGLLRTGEEAERAPQPGLADLPALIDLARDSGTPMTARLPASGVAMAEAEALTVYRIVQEALTNIRKHAGPGAAATVTVQVSPTEVMVEVGDDGLGAGNSGDEGHGLVGMAERVALHGGELTAGPGRDGGWMVRARWRR